MLGIFGYTLETEESSVIISKRTLVAGSENKKSACLQNVIHGCAYLMIVSLKKREEVQLWKSNTGKVSGEYMVLALS